MPNGTFDDEREGFVASRDYGYSIIDEGCAMMVGSPVVAIACGRAPTVGGNGLYRYCARHMQMVADAGATTLQYDDTPVVDDPDVPSPIDSDAPASVHGGSLVTTRERARELFGRGSELGEYTPLPFQIVER